MSSDQGIVAQRAHQLEMKMHIAVRECEKIAVRHLVEKVLNLGRGRLGFRELSADVFLDRREPARGIDRLAMPMLEDFERAHIKFGEQHVAPVVVDVGRNRAHIGKGQ